MQSFQSFRHVALNFDTDYDPNLNSHDIMEKFTGRFASGTICVAIITVGREKTLVIRRNKGKKHAEDFVIDYLENGPLDPLGFDSRSKVKVKLFVSYSPCEDCIDRFLNCLLYCGRKLKFEIIFTRLYYNGKALKKRRRILDEKCGIKLDVVKESDWHELTELVCLWECYRLRKDFLEGIKVKNVAEENENCRRTLESIKEASKEKSTDDEDEDDYDAVDNDDDSDVDDDDNDVIVIDDDYGERDDDNDDDEDDLHGGHDDDDENEEVVEPEKSDEDGSSKPETNSDNDDDGSDDASLKRLRRRKRRRRISATDQVSRKFSKRQNGDESDENSSEFETFIREQKGESSETDEESD